MKDETLMAEELGRLRTENKDLQTKLSDAVYDLGREKAYSIAGGTLTVGPVLCVIAALVLRAIFCSGDITHCYVDGIGYTDHQVALKGNIDGLSDETLGLFKSTSEAVQQAQAIGCPMWRRK